MDLYEKLPEELKRAVRILPPDVEALIMSAQSREESVLGRMVLDRIAENISAARSGPVPLCQDCGMFHALVRVGRSCPYSMAEIGDEITRACRDAAEAAWYRRSTVSDPVYDRVNTGDNLPVVFNWELVDGASVTADILLKGFGSENCSSVRMLRPTDGEDGVIGAVDLIAAGAERAISDHGLSIPSDISVIGIDNSPFAEICNPRLTSLDTRLFELSTSCADVLLSVLSGGSPERVASIPPALVVRET